MAWCRQAASHCLSQCWARYICHITRPQWVNWNLEIARKYWPQARAFLFNLGVKYIIPWTSNAPWASLPCGSLQCVQMAAHQGEKILHSCYTYADGIAVSLNTCKWYDDNKSLRAIQIKSYSYHDWIIIYSCIEKFEISPISRYKIFDWQEKKS